MNDDIIERLLVADSAHFRTWMQNPHWYPEGKPCVNISFIRDDPSLVGSICWWMLSQLPKGTILCWEDKQNKFVCYVRTKEGRDVNAYGVRGFGETREDALIDAYIKWKQSQAFEAKNEGETK